MRASTGDGEGAALQRHPTPLGAAFDFLAGVKPQAPAWMKRSALEWLFPFIHEPAWLWERYLFDNPRFVALAAAELLGIWGPKC